MKRLLVVLIALTLLALPMLTSHAAETGELLITSEKVSGEVGKIVKVNFYLYPNLPEGQKLGSLQGFMKYDSDFVTLGAINQTDTEANLSSWMKGRASKFEYNPEPGLLRFAFFDGYGIEEGGFWFQAEFRIEKEGATDFVFNGIAYSGIDETYATVLYSIAPVSCGGIYTEGQTVPTMDPHVTFAPLNPEMPTPTAASASPTSSGSAEATETAKTTPTATAKATATAKPSNGNSGTATAKPSATPTPKPTATPAAEKQSNAPTEQAPSTDITSVASDTPEPTTEALSSAPVKASEPPKQPEQSPSVTEVGETEQQSNLLLLTGMTIGLVALIGLGAILTILILKRRKKEEN